MTKGIMIKRQFQVRCGRCNRRQVVLNAKSTGPVGRIPRISRLMALAIRFELLINKGAIADQASLAHLGRVSRARATQVMNLLNVAPDIQEQLLELQPTVDGRDKITERSLRSIAAQCDWRKQRRMWSRCAT